MTQLLDCLAKSGEELDGEVLLSLSGKSRVVGYPHTSHIPPTEPDLLSGLNIKSFCLRRKLATRIKELQVALEGDASPNTAAAGGTATGYAEDTVGDQEEQSKGSQAHMHGQASHASASRLHQHLQAVLHDLDAAAVKAPAVDELLRARQHVMELLSNPYVLGVGRTMDDAATDDTATATLPQTPLLPYVPPMVVKAIGASLLYHVSSRCIVHDDTPFLTSQAPSPAQAPPLPSAAVAAPTLPNAAKSAAQPVEVTCRLLAGTIAHSNTSP